MWTASSPDDAKLALLRSLFGARSDVYATRWENASTGKAGWSPAARGGWSRRRSRQDYLPLTDEVFRAHLQGRATIGIYPLLRGDTCSLLACDFDKGTWVLDALAYLDACHAEGYRRHWSVRVRATAATCGSSSTASSPRPTPGRWARRCCGRRCRRELSWISPAMTGSSRPRTISPRPGSGTSSLCRSSANPPRRQHIVPRSNDIGAVAGPVGIPFVGGSAVTGRGGGARSSAAPCGCRAGLSFAELARRGGPAPPRVIRVRLGPHSRSTGPVCLPR